MGKGFISLFYLLAVILPLIALYVSIHYTLDYEDVEFSPAGLFVDGVFSDISQIVSVDTSLKRVNATHIAISSNSTVPKDMGAISSNIKSYRSSLESALDSLGWNYTIDFSQLESNNPLQVYFTSGHLASYDNNDFLASFSGTGNEDEINTTIYYDPQGPGFFRVPWIISFFPGSVEWNVKITDNTFGPPLIYSFNVDPSAPNQISILYFPPLSFLNVRLTNSGGNPATTIVNEFPAGRNGQGEVNFTYLSREENYTFAYLPGNLTINQSNVYKSPIGIVIGEG